MVRKLAAAMLSVGVLIPGLANALGLGEIKLNSALSEPLDAEIELVQVRELTESEILPTLASQGDFSAANVERFHFLTDLKFEVVVNQAGRSVIKIRSRKPVKEPFLNFLVEVNWPAGRLLREYTLLLDPPTYSEQDAAPVNQARSGTSTPSSRSTVSTGSEDTQGSSARSSGSASSYDSSGYTEPSSDNDTGVQTHTISANDNLWALANKMKPSSGVSVQQTMMAIQRISPDAFINNNINLLKKGKVLRAPSESEALQLSNRDAIELVAEQNRQWRERLGYQDPDAGELDARQISLSNDGLEAAEQPRAAGETGRLKLVSADDGVSQSGTATGGAGGAAAGQLQDQLDIAEENVDKFRIENEDLRIQVQDLEDQVDASDKVLSLKDEQIAAMQAKLQQLEQQAELAASAATETASETVEAADESSLLDSAVTADDDAMMDEVAGDDVESGESDGMGDLARKEIDAAVAEFEDEVVEGGESDFTEEDSVADMEDDTMVEDSDPADTYASDEGGFEDSVELQGVTMDDAKPETLMDPEDQVATPAPVEAPSSNEGLIEQIMNNPIYLAAAGGGIVLLLVAGMLIARRKQMDSEVDDGLIDDFEMPEDEPEYAQQDDVDEYETLSQDDENEVVEFEPVDEESTVPLTNDAIGEADIYIAYGRYPQAVELLEKAVDGEPERSDLRLKLCEIGAKTDDPDLFMTHYGVLNALGDAAALAKADALRGGFSGEADEDNTFEPEPDTDFGEHGGRSDTIVTSNIPRNDTIVSMPSPPQNEDATEAFDFDIDDQAKGGALDEESDTGLEFDISDLDTSTTSESELGDVPGVDANMEQVAGLDFDLDMDLNESPDKTSSEESDDASFDLDVELNELAGKGALEDDDSMDFDLDLDLDTSSTENESADAKDEFDTDFALDSSLGSDDSITADDADTGLDFDLDIDSASNTPGLSESDEPELDSASAAKLADELDLDSDFLSGPDTVSGDDVMAAAPDAGQLQQAANDVSEADDGMDFLTDADESSTKLDLARAYIDMGDRDGAKDILDEVLIEGSDNQKEEAKELLTRLES